MHYAAVGRAFAPTPTMPSATAAIAVLLATAAIRPLSWGLGYLGVHLPFAHHLVNLLGLASVVLVLVWLHGAFTAMKGRTSFSPGMAIASWFIPIANLVMPALVLRDGWRTANGSGGGIAFLWMIAWWLTTATTVLGSLGLHFASSGGPVSVILMNEKAFEIPGIDIGTVGLAYSLLAMVSSALAYGLLALIVQRTSQGAKR
jgi:hypothetical protein